MAGVVCKHNYCRRYNSDIYSWVTRETGIKFVSERTRQDWWATLLSPMLLVLYSDRSSGLHNEFADNLPFKLSLNMFGVLENLKH